MKKGLINIEAMYNLQMSEFCEHQRLQISQNEMYAKCLECGALLKYQLNKLINFNQMSNKQYIVLPGGKECKLKNPYSPPKGIEPAERSKYWEFDKTNPTLAITEVMPEGEEFSGSEVTQYLSECEDYAIWENKQPSDYYYNGKTRIAIKPLKAIEPVKEISKGAIVLGSVSFEDDSFKISPSPNVVENKEETVEDKYYPISCDHKIKNGKYAGWSSYSLQSAFTSSGVQDIIREFNLWVCKRCGEIKISAKQDVGDKIAYINQEFSIYMPDAVAAIVKNCNYMNKETDGYIPFVQSQSIEGVVGFVLEKAKDRIMDYLDSAYTDEEKGYQRGIESALSVFNYLEADILKELKK